MDPQKGDSLELRDLIRKNIKQNVFLALFYILIFKVQNYLKREMNEVYEIHFSQQFRLK